MKQYKKDWNISKTIYNIKKKFIRTQISCYKKKKKRNILNL